MSIDYNTPAATSVTIRPDNAAEESYTLGRKSFQKATPGDNNSEGFWGEDGFGFDDLLDLVNPLQHIPIVSTAYRAITGDEIAPGPRMLGGGLLGGVTGFMASAANVIIEQETGSDIATSVAAMFDDTVTTNTDSDAEPILIRPQNLSDARDALEEVTEELTPLDFSQLQTPALPASLPAASSVGIVERLRDQDKHDTILELFGAEVAKTYQDTQEAQMAAYVMDIAKDMKV